MHLPSLLPDWNSVDSVRYVHSLLEGVALAFFALLVLSEALVHLSKDERKKHVLDLLSVVLFAVAVLAEVAAYPYGQRNDTVSEQIIVSLSGTAKQAAINAHSAIEDSGAALQRAREARDKAGLAEIASAKATGSAHTALTIASDAYREADSFERDIVSAKNTAANAEAHLADALQRAAEAEKELKNIRSPRSLVNRELLVAALRPYAGTEYAVNSFHDEEAMQFTRTIDSLLREAGWHRKQPGGLRIGITTLNLFGKDRNNTVEVCLETGVQIHIRSKNPSALLQAKTVAELPQDLRGVYALSLALPSHIFPMDERNVGDKMSVDEEVSEGPPTICIGKKP